MFNTFESQILIGTVLGGSSLTKPPKGQNYYLSMRSQNKDWLTYKMLEMKKFFPKIKLYKYNKTYRCNSCCHKIITDLYDFLYDNNQRKIKMEILDILMDIGIAIWFLDSGGKTGRNKKNAYINTTKFNKEGSKIILKYFQEIGMPCNINHDGKRLKILFSVKGTETLLKTIAHRFPNFMINKI